MVTSAQLRAARAYLDWTMERAAKAAGLHRRTVIRLENDKGYADRQPASLKQLIAAYRLQRIVLNGDGLAIEAASTNAVTPPAPDNSPD